MGVHDGARASFVGSLFAGNNLIDDFSGPAVIEADADEYSDAPTKVRSQQIVGTVLVLNIGFKGLSLLTSQVYLLGL